MPDCSRRSPGAQVELNKAASKVDDTKKQVESARAQVQLVTEQARAAREDVDALVQTVEDSRSQAENARLGLDVAIERLTTEAKAVDANAFLVVALSPVIDSDVFREAKKTARDLRGSLNGLAGLRVEADVASWRCCNCAVSCGPSCRLVWRLA